jgi:hypothetical protein
MRSSSRPTTLFTIPKKWDHDKPNCSEGRVADQRRPGRTINEAGQTLGLPWRNAFENSLAAESWRVI